MPSRSERRADALEAIAKALLELAAVERESDDLPAAEVLIDRRNCQEQVGLSPSAFVAAAGRDFEAFRVSRRLTATKENVLAWLKSRAVSPKASPSRVDIHPAAGSDEFLNAVHARFVSRVGRSMSDDELERADMLIDAGKSISAHMGTAFDDTPDQVAARVQEDIGKEPRRYAEWRSLGLDPALMVRQAEELRARLYAEHPEWSWRDRTKAVWDMWSVTMDPLYEKRRAERAAARAERKAEKIRRGQLGLSNRKRRRPSA